MPDPDSVIPASEPLWALSTDGFSPADRFDAWHAACSAFNDCQVSPEDRTAFRASTEYWSLGRFTLCRNASTPLRLVRSDAEAARDQLDHDVIVVGVVGKSRTESKRRDYALATGDVAFGTFREGYDFRITSPGPARWIELICPPTLKDLLAEFGAGGLGSGAGHTPQAQLLGQFIVSVAQRLPQLTSADLPLIEQALLCLLATARLDPSSDSARLSGTARETMDRARAVGAIERELSSARLTADKVCDMTGISRSTLYRLFEADGGVASYIRTRRLDALRGDLVDLRKRGHTVAQLAERRGFYSLSTLNRAFRSTFGCTPGEVRTSAAAPATAADTIRMDGMMDYLRSQRQA